MIATSPRLSQIELARLGRAETGRPVEQLGHDVRRRRRRLHCQKSRHGCPQANDINFHVVMENGLKSKAFRKTGPRSRLGPQQRKIEGCLATFARACALTLARRSGRPFSKARIRAGGRPGLMRAKTGSSNSDTMSVRLDRHCEESRHACPSRTNDIGSQVAVETDLETASLLD